MRDKKSRGSWAFWALFAEAGGADEEVLAEGEVEMGLVFEAAKGVNAFEGIVFIGDPLVGHIEAMCFLEMVD